MPITNLSRLEKELELVARQIDKLLQEKETFIDQGKPVGAEPERGRKQAGRKS